MTLNSRIDLDDQYAPRVGPLRPSIYVGAETDAIPGYPLDFGVGVDGNGVHPRFIWNDNLTKLAHDTFGEERFERGFAALQGGIEAFNQPIKQLREGFNQVYDGAVSGYPAL